MYLRTPKRYSARGRRRHLFNLRWLWLYLLAPLIIIPAVLAWEYRGPISQSIAEWTTRNMPKINLNPPTPTPTVPAADLEARFVSYVQAGSMKNAIAALTSLAETRPNDPTLYAMLTKMILFRGDPADQSRTDDALRAAYGALNADPESPDGWIMVAMALNSANRPQAALPYLLRARDFDSSDPLMLAVLANTYNSLERPERAEGLADEAIDAAKARNPVDVIALAYAYVVKGNIVGAVRSGEEAVRAYEEAWRVALTEPSMPVGYIAQWLWTYYFNTPQPGKIIDVLTQAAARDKDDPMNPYLLGRVYLKDGDPNRARTFFERCGDLDPNQAKCLRWLGTLMYREGNLQRAAELGQRAVDLGSTDAGAYLVAGAAYAYTNRCAEAVPLLQVGLEMANSSEQYASLVPQFRDALRTCGISGNVSPIPTATGMPDTN